MAFLSDVALILRLAVGSAEATDVGHQAAMLTLQKLDAPTVGTKPIGATVDSAFDVRARRSPLQSRFTDDDDGLIYQRFLTKTRFFN